MNSSTREAEDQPPEHKKAPPPRRSTPPDAEIQEKLNSITKREYRNTKKNTEEFYSVGIPWVFLGYSLGIPGKKQHEQRCALFYDTVRAPRGWDRILLIFSKDFGSSTMRFFLFE